MAKYSFILPVHNGGSYIKECVASILSQTLKDFNLIILENKSNDGTYEWLQALNDSRIQLYPAEMLLPIRDNWARITAIPKNEFITLTGHDDLFDRDYLAVMDKLINKNPGASLFCTQFRYIDAGGNTIRQCKPIHLKESLPEFLRSILMYNSDIMGTGFLMRAADYNRIGGMPLYPNFLFADFELWLQLTMLGYKIAAVETCFSFRQHQSSTSKSADAKFLNDFGILIDYFKRLKTTDSNCESIIDSYGANFLHYYCKSLSHRLLRSKLKDRGNIKVKNVIQKFQEFALVLGLGSQFKPYTKPFILSGLFVDSNIITRWLFLHFKKIFPRVVFSK